MASAVTSGVVRWVEGLLDSDVTPRHDCPSTDAASPLPEFDSGSRVEDSPGRFPDAGSDLVPKIVCQRYSVWPLQQFDELGTEAVHSALPDIEDHQVGDPFGHNRSTFHAAHSSRDLL